MKVVRSGVQKLIKNECPNLLDVGSICHLADLTIKEGMKTLPVDIDQLFIDVFYYFFHSSIHSTLLVSQHHHKKESTILTHLTVQGIC